MSRLAVLPTLEEAMTFAAEPSTEKILRGVFGCVDHAWGKGWLVCPDGVKRHAFFGSGDGERSAEEVYLRWDVTSHVLASIVSIDGPTGDVLDTKSTTRTARVGVKDLVAFYGAPTSRVCRSAHRTFNGIPARVVTTSGRVLEEVTKAHEAALHAAQNNKAERAEWWSTFQSIRVPETLNWKPPAKIVLPKAYKAPARRDFAPVGFAPGAWFEWTDERGGVTYRCQVVSAGPRTGYVWVAGSHDGASTFTWVARLNHSGKGGKRDGSAATSLDVLAHVPGDAGSVFGARLATVEDMPADEPMTLEAA